MADINIKSETINRLLDIISKGIGAIWEYNTADKKLLKVGKAEAENEKQMIIKKAEGEAEATLINVKTDLEVRALNRFVYQETKKQKNIENIIEGSIPYLEGKSFEGNVNEDWINNFFNYAGNISNEEIQILWSKILAGEVKKPGSFSLRVLDMLKNLSQKEADNFNKLSGLICNGANIIKLDGGDDVILDNSGLRLVDLIELTEIGLISHDNIISIRKELDFNNQIRFIFKNKEIITTATKKITLHVGIYKLTSVGQGLYKIINPNANEKYVNNLSNFLTSKGISNNIIEYNLGKQ